MSIVAKFKCNSVSDHKGSDGEKAYETVYLSAVYSEDPAHENYSWSKLTPAGQLNLSISNPAAFGAFETGREYLVTIAPA